MGIQDSLIELINSIPSNSIEYIPIDYVEKNLWGIIADYQEWIMARCGENLSADIDDSDCETKAFEAIRAEAFQKEFKNAVEEVKPANISWSDWCSESLKNGKIAEIDPKIYRKFHYMMDHHHPGDPIDWWPWIRNKIK
jgi:hypothetical protein